MGKRRGKGGEEGFAKAVRKGKYNEVKGYTKEEL